MIRYNEEKKANEICLIEIFQSLNGEGWGSGLPTVFVRTFGCNLRCKYNTVMNDNPKSILNGFCDTPECFTEEHFKELYPNRDLMWLTAQEIFEKVEKLATNFKHKSVCITGGEPLLEENKMFMLDELIARFINPALPKDTEWDVSVETNGSIDYLPYKKMYGNANIYNADSRTGLTLVTDWKFPHSCMDKKMLESNLSILYKGDIIKIVIGDDEKDWEYLDSFIEKVKAYNCKASIYLSPMYKKSDTERMWRYATEHSDVPIRLQLQLHKMFFKDPNEKGV